MKVFLESYLENSCLWMRNAGKTEAQALALSVFYIKISLILLILFLKNYAILFFILKILFLFQFCTKRRIDELKIIFIVIINYVIILILIIFLIIDNTDELSN